MAYADEKSYEEVISTLQNYITQVNEQCSAMESAGTDCIDNTDGDSAAEKSVANLQKCVGNIRIATKEIQRIATALQEEIDETRMAAAKVD